MKTVPEADFAGRGERFAEGSAGRLRTRTVPRCLATISELIHKPSPVPVVSLVVKKASKMRFRTAWVHAGTGIRDHNANARNLRLILD